MSYDNTSDNGEFAYRTKFYQKLKQLNTDIYTFKQNSKGILPKREDDAEKQIEKFRYEQALLKKLQENTKSVEGAVELQKKLRYHDQPNVNIIFDRNDDDLSDTVSGICKHDDDKSSLNSPYGTPPRTPKGLDLGLDKNESHEIENSNIM